MEAVSLGAIMWLADLDSEFLSEMPRLSSPFPKFLSEISLLSALDSDFSSEMARLAALSPEFDPELHPLAAQTRQITTKQENERNSRLIARRGRHVCISVYVWWCAFDIQGAKIQYFRRFLVILRPPFLPKTKIYVKEVHLTEKSTRENAPIQILSRNLCAK